MHQNPEPIPEQVANSIGLILSNSMLTESHAYLQQCERHPEFVRVLFNIFERLEVGPLREAVFLTCVNVIKRNMHHNRRVAAVGIIGLIQSISIVSNHLLRTLLSDTACSDLRDSNGVI